MHTASHRHFVAVPLCALAMLAISVLELWVFPTRVLHASSPATGIASPLHDSPFSLPGIVAGTFEPQSDVRVLRDSATLRLIRGGVLLRTAGYTRVSAGTLTVTVLRGAVSVRSGAEGTTVAAIDVPLLVATPSALRLLSPGEQFFDSVSLPQGRITAIPKSWLLQKQDELRAIELPVADSVHAGGASGGTDFAALLGSDFDSDHVRRALDLLSSTDPSVPLRSLLALTLARDPAVPRGDTLLSGGLGTPLLSDGDVARAIAILASGERPLPDAFVDRWREASLRASVHDARDVAATLDLAAGLPSAFESLGYPKYARAWQQTIDEVRSVVNSLVVPPPETDRREADQTLQVSSTASSAPLSTPQTVDLTQVRRDLLSSGAMFTAASTVQQIASQPLVRVEGVYFATSEGDRRFDFIYDPQNRTLSHIQRDGVAMPNTVALRAFGKD